MSQEKIAYWQQLKDPRWQKKRLEILQRSNFRCECCGEGEETLHIHHRYYQRGIMAWDYPDDSLVAVCETCHDGLADAERVLLESIMPRDVCNMYEFASAVSDLSKIGIGLKPVIKFCNNLFRKELNKNAN